MTIWPKALSLIALLGAGFAAQAMFFDDKPRLATPAQVEGLTRLLSICPELSPEVAQRLDQREGLLMQSDINELSGKMHRCHAQRDELPAEDRYRLAYSALKGLVAAHPIPARHQPALSYGPNAVLSIRESAP